MEETEDKVELFIVRTSRALVRARGVRRGQRGCGVS